MSVTLQIHPLIRHLTNNQKTVEVKGANVSQCLENLVSQFPATRDWLYNNEGGLRETIELYINGENIFPEGLSKPVHENDRIDMLMLLSGG